MPPRKSKLNLDSLQVSGAQLTALIRTLIGVAVFVFGGVLSYVKVQYDQIQALKALQQDMQSIIRVQWTLQDQREFAHQMRNMNDFFVPSADSIHSEFHKNDK